VLQVFALEVLENYMKPESPDLQNTTKYYAVPCCDVQIVGSEDVSQVK